jgi:flagellar hook-associated protein 3 FlgL
MSMRVTNQTMMHSAQRSLQTNLVRLADLQEKASGQRAITRPSDDPAAAADSLRVRADIRANEQYGRSIANGEGWLTQLESTMTQSKQILDRANELTLRASNGSMSPAAREATAIEIDSLRSELAAQANASYGGRFLFAGNSDAGSALGPNLTFSGTGTVERRIGADQTVRVDADGAAVFGSGPTSAFALLDTMAADLRAGKDVSTHLGPLQQRIKDLTNQHSEIGTRHARLLQAKDVVADASLALEGKRAAVEDVDLATVILDLKLQETAYQSALAVSARVLQPSLMDFLR